jgi:hypothetical protein
MRSLEQWLAYQTQVHPQTIDLSLDRLRVVLERLRWRQPRIPVITVAGTNGKGSVSAYCAAILGAAGFRVGAFTSPHLRDYRERIRVHDRLARPDELVAAFEKIEDARGSVALTFFEFNALAALLVFEAAALDAWVLEIGMGGRLDAVNVVDPSVAVVTSIGLDHQEYLGDTLEAIAREKAGIFRPGRTAVIGGREPSPVLESIAGAMGAPLKRLAIEYNYILEGFTPPAGAGAGGRYSIHQCRDCNRGSGGNRTAPQYPGRCRRARADAGTPGRPLPSDPTRDEFANLGVGCRTQSGRGTRARAQSERQSGCRADSWRVRDSR